MVKLPLPPWRVGFGANYKVDAGQAWGHPLSHTDKHMHHAMASQPLHRLFAPKIVFLMGKRWCIA